MRVLFAVGEPNMSTILRGHLVENRFDVINQEVFHRKYLEEVMQYEKPSIVIIHDHYLESDFESSHERDQEMLRIIDNWRLQFETTLRVVYLCERERNDPFLGALVARNVLDIFYQRVIPTQIFIKQLLEPPKFGNVARLGVSDLDLTDLEFKDVNNSEVVQEKIEEAEVAQKIKTEKVKSSQPKLISKQGLQIHVHHHAKEKIAVPVDRKVIVVVSPYERSGSTFIAHQIAYQVARESVGVTYFENPFRRPYSFDRFGGHLVVPEYRSLYSDNEPLETKEAVERKWMVDGVSLQVLNPIYEMPYSEKDIPVERFYRIFLQAIDTPILIIDIGADRQRTIYDELIDMATHVVVVMDCDIPNLEWFHQNQISPDFNWIYRVLKDERNMLVANRYVKEAKGALPNNEFISIPTIQNDWIFQSQLKGKFIWSSKEASKVQNELFGIIAKKLIPNSFLEQTRGKFGKWLPKIKITKA